MTGPETAETFSVLCEDAHSTQSERTGRPRIEINGVCHLSKDGRTALCETNNFTQPMPHLRWVNVTRRCSTCTERAKGAS
jgi:hypothetical protein